MGLSEYLRFKVLGKGSYGKVYLVKHVKEDRFYALKMVDQRKISAEEKEATQRELQLMKQFTHPNIVAYRDGFFTANSTFFCIVMTYCEGGDLQSVITKSQKSEKPLSESLIMDYFVQILLGLEFMHHNNVLHRDLKAQNMFLLGNGRLVLGDLGIARSIGINLAETTVGTPYYMSPEIYNRRPYDLKSDIWSLGCVLYELLTFQHPFEGNSIIALSHCVRKGVYKPISSDYSKEINQLLQMMLTVDPTRRPSAESLFALPFVQFHVAELINDILDRPATALGEGTLQIRNAILGGAKEANLDWTLTSKLPDSSPQAQTLRSQMGYLNLNDYIRNRYLSKATVGSGKDAAESQKIDFQRDLEIQMKRKEAIQNAVRAVEKTKQDVLSKEALHGAVPPRVSPIPPQPLRPAEHSTSRSLLGPPPVTPPTERDGSFSQERPARAAAVRPVVPAQPAPPFPIPPGARESALKRREDVGVPSCDSKMREKIDGRQEQKLSDDALPLRNAYFLYQAPPAPRSRPFESKRSLTSESPSSESEYAQDGPSRVPSGDSFNTQIPRNSSDIAKREEDLKRELNNVEVRCQRIMAIIGMDVKQTGIRTESSDSESGSSASVSEEEEESPSQRRRMSPELAPASMNRRALLNQRLVSQLGRECYESLYRVISLRRTENGGQDLNASDSSVVSQLSAIVGATATAAPSSLSLPRLISDYNQLFFLENFQE